MLTSCFSSKNASNIYTNFFATSNILNNCFYMLIKTRKFLFLNSYITIIKRYTCVTEFSAKEHILRRPAEIIFACKGEDRTLTSTIPPFYHKSFVLSFVISRSNITLHTYISKYVFISCRKSAWKNILPRVFSNHFKLLFFKSFAETEHSA